jgi:hypothetical protein
VRRKAKQSRSCSAGGQIHQVQKSFHLLIHRSSLHAHSVIDGLGHFLRNRFLIRSRLVASF